MRATRAQARAWLHLLPVVLIVVSFTSGCGGSDSDSEAAAAAAVAYQEALAAGDSEKICELQTRAKLRGRAMTDGNGKDPLGTCRRYYAAHPELSSAADLRFEVTDVRLEPRVISLAVADLVGPGAATLPLRKHGQIWQIDGQAGAPGFSGEGDGDPVAADSSTVENVRSTYARYLERIRRGRFLEACDLLTPRYRLALAKEMDEVGSVASLCARSLRTHDSSHVGEGEVTGVRLSKRSVPEAEIDVRLGGLEGVWYMRFEDEAWRFSGGGLIDPQSQAPDPRQPDRRGDVSPVAPQDRVPAE